LKTSLVFAAVVVLAIGTVILVNVQVYSGGSAAPAVPASTYSNSASGLRLVLSINSTTLATGQRLMVDVSEVNTLATPNDIASAQEWGIPGLRISACYASTYPFGIAVFQGRYSSANVSEAKPLQIFPLVPCPLLIRLVTGYHFEANSSQAVVLLGTGPAIPMEANVTLRGTYSAMAGSAPSATAASRFAPGTYTVVAGDEWGALALLYFTIE